MFDDGHDLVPLCPLFTFVSSVVPRYTRNRWVRARVRHVRAQRELRGRQGALSVAADGDPLRAPGDARRPGHRLAPPTRTRSAWRSTACRRTTIRDVNYDGTYEDLFFYVERLIVQACGEDVAGRLHTARSRNDIDMTMYRMRQREFMLGLLAATLRSAPVAARPRRPASRHDVRRPHAHAAGAADDRRALPARGRRAARARRDAAEGRLRAHQPEPARRLRDHRHRVSTSIGS